MRKLGVMLAVSIAVTESILLLEGRWQEAIPLHLCSVSAIAAFLLAMGGGNWLLDFLWYLGMPGALLALMFPAPAVTEHQVWLNVSYVTTHLLILLIPSYALTLGRRVRKGMNIKMLLTIHILAVPALIANLLLGTDFMFLQAPPYGTPLCVPYQHGYGVYLLALEALIGLLLLVTGRLMPKLWPKLFMQVNV